MSYLYTSNSIYVIAICEYYVGMAETDIGKNIRNARLIRGMTQRELAEKLDVSWEMISRYETNKVNPMGNLIRIAGILSVPVSFLLGETGLYMMDSGDEYVEVYKKRGQLMVPYVLDSSVFTSNTGLLNVSTLYAIPSWIRDCAQSEVFAVPCKDVDDTEILHVDKDGTLIVAVDDNYRGNDFVMCATGGKSILRLYVQRYRQLLLDDKTRILGKVLSYEKRFTG